MICGFVIFSIACILNQNFVSSQKQIDQISSEIKKCRCERTQVENGIDGQCIPYPVSRPLLVQIWNETASNAYVVDPFTFMDVVRVRPLNCPDNTTKESSTFFPFFSKTGKLLLKGMEIDDYCLEFVLNKDENPLQRVEWCVSPLVVPLCCDIGEYMDSGDRCTPIPNQVGKDFVQLWLRNYNHFQQPISECEKEIQREPLDPKWSSSNLRNALVHYQQISGNNMCVAMFGDENEIYPRIRYCPSSSTNIVLIPSCCPQGYAFNLRNGTCDKNPDETFSFPENIVWHREGRSVIRPLNCSNTYLLTLNPSAQYTFSVNGSLRNENGTHIPSNEYCLGPTLYNDTAVHSDASGAACVPDPVKNCSWRWDVYQASFVISCIFVVATLIVYLGLPELRNRIGGVCLISELVALLVSQITFIVLQANREDFTSLSKGGCLAIGVIEIISMLASFFWLNIMCFDVWSTFRKFRPFSEKTLNVKLLIKYSLYGWGIPLVVGVIAIILEVLDAPLKPDFRPNSSCYFTSRNLNIHWFYVYGLILILTLINCFFFVHVAFTLTKNNMEHKKHLRSSTGKSNRGSGNSDQNQNFENAKLYGKLFIIMGIPWLIEVFSSFASTDIMCYIWFLDLLNMLRGVLIFIVFVCKKTTRDKMNIAWCPIKTASKPNTSSGNTISLSSLSSWLPSFHGRKFSKVSVNNINLEAVRKLDSKQDVVEGVDGDKESKKALIGGKDVKKDGLDNIEELKNGIGEEETERRKSDEREDADNKELVYATLQATEKDDKVVKKDDKIEEKGSSCNNQVIYATIESN